MRYNITDRHAFIRLLQRYLGVRQSGAIDANTSKCILKFKAEHGLEKDERVDFKTFQLMKKVYHNKVNNTSEVYAFGSQGMDVRHINSMICCIIREYGLDAPYPRGGYYGVDTERSVLFLREMFMLEKCSYSDSTFIARLEKEVDAIERNKRNMKFTKQKG